MLADLNVVPLRSLSQAAQDLYILASPQSPMRELLAVDRAATDACPAPPPPAAGRAAGAVARRARQGAPRQRQGGASRAVRRRGAAAPPPPGHEIDERYKALRDFVGDGPGAPIDLVLRLLGDLQQQLAKLARDAGGAGAAPARDRATIRRCCCRPRRARQPQPVARWLAAIAASAIALRSGGARQQVAAAFNGERRSGPICASGGRRALSVRRRRRRRHPARRFRPAVRAGRRCWTASSTRQLRPFVDTAGPDLAAAAGGRRGAAGVAGGSGAVPARRGDPRPVLRRRRQRSRRVRFDITPVTLDAAPSR